MTEENKIQILVVEDDSGTALRTESLIYALGYKLLKTVDNSEEALEVIKEQKPDILVMDIDIKGALNGIEVVAKVKDLQIPVIFVTGFDQEKYYEKARKTQPAAYLVKPFSKFTFQTALENAILGLSKKSIGNPGIKQSTEDNDEEWADEVWLKDSFFIKRNNLLYKVKIDDIQYIQSEGNYCEIISNKKHAVKISLVQLLKKLPASRFVRIHQRCVIKADMIDNIDISTNQVYVGGKSLPLGPKYKEDILRIADRL